MKLRFFASSLFLATLLSVAPPALHAQTSDTQLQSQAQRVLRPGRFKDIHVAVQNGTITLSGSVKYFSDKADAEKRVKKADHNAPVENSIQVDTPEVPNDKLEQKLVNDINNSRIGYGTTAFNAISVAVRGNGTVILGGFAYGPVDASTAYNLAANTKGVRDVINHIHIDPPSPQDDRIRRMAYRAIYLRAPQLNKYALNPVKPIRIQVENGHITLYGAVDSQSDKQVAGIQANSVPGVFSVTNELHVTGQEH